MTDYLPKVARVRAQINKLADDIRELSDGMPPKEEALAAVDAHIQREAEKVTIRPSAVTGGGGEFVSAYPESPHAYACKFFPDVIRNRLRTEVEAIYQGEVTITDDQKQERLEAQLLELERQEEAVIREAAADGKSIPRRSDANPVVLLD
ncbi:hypothetical protein [Stenotrophomonas indicatrix]|uniref:hypothetical protein n=1 Tax=Stenotrophomonas indicatrix TaxID=2045451 RepID=UPI000FD6E06D|nr:hypothetical protein [Stenotrophomonas indicatrix]